MYAQYAYAQIPVKTSSHRTGENPQVTSGRVVWLALFVYAAMAVALFSSTWVDPAGSWIGSPKDPQLFIWYLGWIPHELAQGHNPLFTDHLSYPSGVNLMWNTSMIFPAVLLWPVTALFGPVVAYNVLVTAGIALSAWLGFLAAGRFIDRQLWCFVTGLVYGFSPALIAQAMGHPHVTVALFPPIALILGHEILGHETPVRRRMRPAVAGALAGAAAALQLLTGEELLAVTLLVAAVGAALLALMNRDQVRSAAPYVLRASGVALLAFAIIAAYPLGFQFLGPQRVYGSVQPPDVYVSDLLAFVVPSRFFHFTGNTAESGAYIGVPLLALFAAGLVMGWRQMAIRWTALMTLIVALLSLGPHLHVDGYVTQVWLPWAAVAWLPLFGSALPGRLMSIAFLGVGMVVAWACLEAFKRTRPWRVGTGVLLFAAVLAFLPSLPSLPFPSEHASAPAFFKPGGGVEKIAPGSVLLVTPFSSKESTDAMYWQAVANYRFKMPEGDAFTPGPYLGPHPSFMKSVLDDLDAGKSLTVTPDVLSRFVADLKQAGVSGGIVVGPSRGQAAIIAFLTEVEGSAPSEDGGVRVWWFYSTP
ncbi:MAG: hypothetical protein AUH69_11065 [Actinobacteria bacterium 13_1_40CM_4_65_12]|nr:MAG: hypothetical protein AUH69_11065 [Actinobacteria bacterium 13_1_40CM_4_65_12]